MFGYWLMYRFFIYMASYFLMSQSEYCDIAVLYFKWLNIYQAENISKVSGEVIY